VQFLVASGADVNLGVPDEHRRGALLTPLNQAASAEVRNWLLANGARQAQ